MRGLQAPFVKNYRNSARLKEHCFRRYVLSFWFATGQLHTNVYQKYACAGRIDEPEQGRLGTTLESTYMEILTDLAST